MHLLYCDESNIEKRRGDFLIYGGLLIEEQKTLDLTRAIDRLRTDRAVPRDYPLKFNPGPRNLSHPQFAALKQEVLELATEHGAKLLVYVILHDIATSPDVARRNGINTVLCHFQGVLARGGGPGLALIDRFNDAGNKIEAHLRAKFTTGLTGMPYSPEIRLSNIVGMHYSTIGQSHFPSIIDVALGSLRFAINAHTRGENLGTAQKLLTILAPMFWREPGAGSISELGFCYSPVGLIKVPRYRAQYEALRDYLVASGVPTRQRIITPVDSIPRGPRGLAA
jgi:hypothetical protein